MAATEKLEHVCGEQWRQCVVQASEALSKLPSDRVVLVRYESFVRQPELQLAELVKFLGIVHQGREVARIAEQVSPARVGRQQDGLSPRFLDSFRPVVAETLRSIVQVNELELRSRGAGELPSPALSVNLRSSEESGRTLQSTSG
jgi:hypothetical protein